MIESFPLGPLRDRLRAMPAVVLLGDFDGYLRARPASSSSSMRSTGCLACSSLSAAGAEADLVVKRGGRVRVR